MEYDVVIVGGGKLLQADRRSEAGRAAADDHNVVFHGFTGHRRSLVRLASREGRAVSL